MKDIIRNIILFILSITFFFCIYVYAFKISVVAICILLALFFAYGMCMGESVEKHGKVKKI